MSSSTNLPAVLSMRAAGNTTIAVPSVGFGTWAPEDPSWCTSAVSQALKVGYRHLDCAWEYGVDREVGEGIRQSSVPRADIFVTSKFWPQFAAPENVGKCLDLVLENMGLDYVDLFLAHFPLALRPSGDVIKAKNWTGATLKDQMCDSKDGVTYIADPEHCPGPVAALNGDKGGSFVPTWMAMKELVKAGKCRAIGVSNFTLEHLQEIQPYASHDDVPISCNQIEAHPWHPNTKLIDFMKSQGILPVIHSPFAPRVCSVENGVVVEKPFAPGGLSLLREPTILAVAERNAMDAGQVIQSWLAQRGCIPLGKSQNPGRMLKNLSIQRLPDRDFDVLSDMALPNGAGRCVDLNLLFPGVQMTPEQV